MKCPFCGYEFEQAKVMCSGCPMHNKCKAVCCPNCGYELERESKLADLAKKLFKKNKES
ncbi:MAG: hypothetical protein Q7N50_03845 [Armatimonadota bacterium]|nr:hypothetical protein [Armatimonadota bacterium]